MAQVAKKKIVVFGGSGFLGSRICEAAVARGWETVSVSRSGTPTWSSITSSSTAPSWSHNVTWASANLFKPASYLPLLDSATAVVHSTGILLEADYKGVLQGREPIVSGIRRAFSAQLAAQTPNPLARSTPTTSSSNDAETQTQPQQADLTSSELSLKDIDLTPQDPTQLTYELMNRDTAVLLARAFAESAPSTPPPQARTFLYISAAASFPLLPPRYLATKRAAESTISSHFAALNSSTSSSDPPHKSNPPTLIPVFLRAPFLSSPTRAITMPLAAATAAGQMFNSATAGVFSSLLGAGAVKSLRVEEMAGAVVMAAEEGMGEKTLGGSGDVGTKMKKSEGGVVEGEELRELATKAWRAGML